MKFFILLLLITSCSSTKKTQTMTLEILGTTQKVVLTEMNDKLILEKKSLPAMELRESNPEEGELAGIYIGSADIKGNRWQASDFTTKETHHWIYQVIIGTPKNGYGERVLTDKEYRPWKDVHPCAKEKRQNNTYLITFIYGDLGGLAVGCLN